MVANTLPPSRPCPRPCRQRKMPLSLLPMCTTVACTKMPLSLLPMCTTVACTAAVSTSQPSCVQLPPSTPCRLATSPFRTRKKVLHAYTTQHSNIGPASARQVGLRSLFALDPAYTACGCRACCHSDDRVVPHQPHKTFTRSDGRHAARRPDARKLQWSRTHADHNAGSDTMQQNAAPSRLSLFALDPANTARGCRACCHSDDRVVPHQPHWTFTRSDGRHAARRPDARRDRWSRTHADHNAGSDTVQLLQRQAGHLNHSKAASRCVIRKNKAVQNKPLNILRSPPLPQRLHVSTTVLVIGALHLPSLHLTSLLARQRGGSAPSILLRCSPCLPRTALPLSSRHRSTAEHPCCAADHWAAATRCKYVTSGACMEASSSSAAGSRGGRTLAMRWYAKSGPLQASQTTRECASRRESVRE